MPIINLKEQITRLVQLQEIDQQIYNLRDEKEAKPAELVKLDAFLEEKRKGLSDAEKEMLTLLKAKKEQEIDLGTKEDSTKKLKSQLYQLKTNKDYAAMLQQIGGVSMMGPFLVGLEKSVQIVSLGAKMSEIYNAAVIAAL